MTRSNLHKFRWITRRLPKSSTRRLVVMTGARQTGKTTLARQAYSELRYVNCDAPENREFVRTLRAMSWGKNLGAAVLDEAQKEPTVFDKVKYSFDEGDITFTVLLGSSQILLLKRIRESLAGRAFFYELFPLMLSEMAAEDEPAVPPLVARLLTAADFNALLKDQPVIRPPQEDEATLAALDYMLTWGGMPALLALDDNDRRQWLQSYGHSYLERDLGDLARLDDLSPFREFQRLTALRSGQILSYSELARDAGIAVSTSRRYLEYLKLSYQTFILPPYNKNLTSTVIKTPKLFLIDIGILRHLQGYWGAPTGELFETFVIAEIYKWVRTAGENVQLYFYRTRAGLEVDLMMQTPQGVLGFEIKSSREIAAKDYRPLRDVAAALKSDWRGGIVVTRGAQIESLDAANKIWCVPVHRLLGF
ncbi:ATP-binding protein [candidate division KSB1 bacterium]|nr:ATP-binding protein [candidate division KSB1 bacterium]